MEGWRDVLLAMGVNENSTPEQLKAWLVQQKATGAAAAAAPLSLAPHPRLPVFSGDRNDSLSFPQFKNEVMCLLKSETEKSVMLAMRRALRGPAGEVLFHMGEETDVRKVIEKLEVVFGEVKSVEQLLEGFYSARQTPKETIAEWGCRLEDMVDRVKRKGAVEDATAVESMLRTKFWAGLASSQVKMALRHLFDQKKSYVELLTQARAAEVEFGTSHVRSQVAEDSLGKLTTQFETVLARLDSMESRLAAMETRRSEKGVGRGRPITCYNCGEQGHIAKQCGVKGNGEGSAPRGGSRDPTSNPH